MRYDKLIRDLIPAVIEKDGKRAVTHIASDAEYWQKLKSKLQEEVAEVLEEKNIPEELADVLEVIHAICAFKQLDLGEIEQLRLAKKQKRGGFDARLILEETQ